MLSIRGHHLGREPSDIDLLIKDHAENIVLPSNYTFSKIGASSDGFGAKFQCDNIIVDVMSSGEESEIVNGFRLGSYDELIKQKIRYSRQNNCSAEKHKNDLILLGHNEPPEETEALPF
jgi:hypothetical protein